MASQEKILTDLITVCSSVNSLKCLIFIYISMQRSLFDMVLLPLGSKWETGRQIGMSVQVKKKEWKRVGQREGGGGGEGMLREREEWGGEKRKRESGQVYSSHLCCYCIVDTQAYYLEWGVK